MAKTVVAIVILVVLLLFNPGLMHIGKLSVARKEIGEDVKIRPVFRYAVNLSLGDLRRQVKEMTH